MIRVGARLRPVMLALPRALARLRRDPPREPAALLGLCLLSAALAAGGLRFGAEWAPASAQGLPLVLGGLLLGRRAMRRLLLVVAVSLGVLLFVQKLMIVRPGSLVVLALTAVLCYESSRSREETGLTGLSGDSVLAELRRRLEQQGVLPRLPRSFEAEAVVRPAGGGPFAGDFVVSSLSDDARRLEVALVDVSGKGVAAGTRALLLSGAMGGLLGTPTPRALLPSANRYLERQAWEEGFATAVHLVLDLRDGSFWLESAGHPPAAHFDAGSGRWSLLEADGPALGLLPDVEFTPALGELDRGDALLLYTDGLVEVPGRDLDVGIDKLLGEAERLVPRGFRGGADVLLRQVAAAGDDDRGLVLIWRAG